MWMRAFNVGAIDAIRQTASVGLPNLNAQLPVIDKDAPSPPSSWLMPIGKLAYITA